MGEKSAMTGSLRTCAAVLALFLTGPAVTVAAPSTAWVGSWATAEQTPEPRNALPEDALSNATLRQTVHVSLGGGSWRLRLSNAFGHAPLTIGAVHVAVAIAPGSPAIDAASDMRVQFDGRDAVIIPAGADYLSDPIRFDAAAGANIAISIYLPVAPDGQTSHPGSRTTSHLVHDNHVAATTLENAQHFEHWFVIAGLEVEATPESSAIVILGDSIADGHGTTTNGNDRWSDDLAARLLKAKLPFAVLNQGIGGNRLLDDGLGPNALARFGRDVLVPGGVRYLIVHEGINDLGTFGGDARHTDAEHEDLVARIIGAYRQIIERAHSNGITVIGATLTPFAGPTYHPTARGEADRAAINAWIRAPGHFDAVVDFDRVVRDPADPLHFKTVYDSGDDLHPSPRGYQAMADAIPLSLFARTHAK
jgi:lysophospholipase L1-like esterase